ncbi:MAG: nucleotidyl transferase AbiEii/AbiGii toxin family protein [Anaerolineaceae bacterium]|nr:nucleotidyl transferase AbiEii/AbiGii toxin family protein [Anaerolineaceae bacterium]
MLDLQQIKEQYTDDLQSFEKSILKEYLQYKILQAIFESKYASKLSFLGGTALRIIYGNNRFSEDIDLDNFGMSWELFAELVERVKKFLELEGFHVQVNSVSKVAFHCYFRFSELLYQQGLSPLHQEKIMIQVDTVSQGYDYQPEIKILNKFDVFTEVRVTPLNLLLSQKIFTAVNRKRAKGRDFYDITFLLSKTKPDLAFLEKEMGIKDPEKLRKDFLERIANYNFKALAEDVTPFVIKQEQISRVLKFKEFWNQVELT